MGLAGGDAGSAHFEYPVVRQASEGRDVVSVRVALHAIFWSLLGLTQAAIHPKTAEANHGDAETRRKTD